MFPLNIGCTGIAITEKKSVYFNEGERSNSFQPDIDNSLGIHNAESLLISPINDNNGRLRGVI